MNASGLIQLAANALAAALPGWSVSSVPEERRVPTSPAAYVVLGPARLATDGYAGITLTDTLVAVLVAPISAMPYTTFAGARDAAALELARALAAHPELIVDDLTAGAASAPEPVEEGVMAWRSQISVVVRRRLA